MTLAILDIIDSAVKIGLGAAVSGLAAYFLTKHQNTHTIKQNTEKRRAAKIEEAADLLEQFNVYSHACSIKVAEVVKKICEPDELHSAASDLSKGLSKITKATTNIQLIGESKIASNFKDLNDLVVQLVNFINNHGSKNTTLLDIVEFNKLIDQISSKKQSILKELSDAFMRL
jgi:hypothetical protein